MLAVLASASLIYLAGTWDALTVRHIDVVGASLTAGDDVRTAAGVGDGANVFGLTTDAVRRRVERLPTVASANVDVGLPDRLSISVVERTPLLAWAVGTRRLLVDDEGRVFADLPADPTDARVARQLADVPAIDDRRAAASGLGVGAAVDPVDFEVARRLGALKPADVGSGASGLRVEVTDAQGFVVRPKAAGWSAVFGLYTPTLRPPTIVPGQVRLLASLLTGRETQVGRVLLASETDGTYEPRESPSASSP
jgi:POTRA domain, FtsQ-type